MCIVLQVGTKIDFMNSYDLVNVYRTLHKDSRKYSCRCFKSTQRSRLNYFLVSEVLGLDITSADIIPGYFSDHLFVLVLNWYC